MMQVEIKSNRLIPAKEMKDMQVAVIRRWVPSSYVGLHVMRVGPHLFALDSAASCLWLNYTRSNDPEDLQCMVEPVPNGTFLIVKDNE
jgi:hypothetical protein